MFSDLNKSMSVAVGILAPTIYVLLAGGWFTPAVTRASRCIGRVSQLRVWCGRGSRCTIGDQTSWSVLRTPKYMLVRLDRSADHIDDEPARVRTGRAYKLGVSKAAFKTVIASRARYKAHSAMLEAHAATLSLQWLLRCPARRSRRTVLLIDAQAVCGAIAKGRSSAPTLRAELNNIAALAIADDLWLQVAFVPSENSPSDAPSRGVVRRWRGRDGQKRRKRGDNVTSKSASTVYDNIWRHTHTGTVAQQHMFRRLFRKYDWSGIDSLSSLEDREQ